MGIATRKPTLNRKFLRFHGAQLTHRRKARQFLGWCAGRAALRVPPRFEPAAPLARQCSQ